MKALKRPAIIISTVFFIGYLPLSGTAASLFGLFLFYGLAGSQHLLLWLTLLFIILGLLLAGKVEKYYAKKDPGCVVIDEVSGMFLSLLFLPLDIRIAILAFIIFRILDIFKPYPADKLQSLNGGLGVMSDDIVAGLYTNLILQLALKLASLRIS